MVLVSTLTPMRVIGVKRSKFGVGSNTGDELCCSPNELNGDEGSYGGNEEADDCEAIRELYCDAA